MKRLFLALAALLALTAGAAEAATPPRGAFTYVGNVDDGSRSGVVDARRLGSSAVSRVDTALDSGDDMTVGDVLGDGFDEVVVADDGEGRIDIHDTSAKTTTSFDTTIGFNVNLYTDRGDDITTGNIVGDAKDEVIVASTRFKLIVVYSATGEELRRLSNKGFEDGDRVLAGDFLPGRDYDEIAIISNEDEGRIDIFNGDAEHLAQRHSAYDGDGDDVAAGDVTGDFAEDVIVANDEEGRIDRVQIVNDTADDRDSAYDGDDRLGVGDMTGDGIAEVVIANTEQNRIDVINYHGAGGNFSSAYDGDDRFAVGTFGSGDLDGDSIPDRVELLGIRDDKGDVLLDLAERGASPCRKDVVVDIARMDGIDPLEEALTNVVDTFAAAAEVVPVADCPYAGASKATGMNLIILETDPAQMRVIPHQKTINGPEAVNALIESTFSLDAPFIRRVLWADDYEIVSNPGTADEIRSSPAGHAGRGKHKLDMVIALDDDKDSTGVDLTSDRRLQVQESTFMHELGHALGLSHGGRVDANCKPNHLSLMNYAFRTGVPKANGDFVIDYSHVELATLDEEHLDERAGIGGSGDFKTAWTNGKGVRDEGDADARLDWDGVDSDGNGVSDDDNGDDGEGVAVDLNVNDPLSASAIPCTNPNGDQAGLQKLTSHNDWAFLNTKLRAPGEEQSSDEEAASEPTVASLVTALENRDQVFFPDQAVRLRPARAGFRDDVLGVAFDANHVYAVHNSRSSATGAIDGKGSLAVLDRKTLTVQSQIAVGLDARAVAVNPVTSRAYVVNRGTGTGSTLSVVNTATRKVISEIKLGQIAADVAVNAKLNRVYISNPGQEDIQVLNGANNALLAPVQVGKGLGGLAVDEVTGTIYVTMSSRGAGNEFAKLGRVRDNGATRSVLPSIDLGDPGTQPVDVAFDSERGRLFVAGLGGGSVSPSVIVLGAALGIELARIPVANPLRAISLNADTGLAFAAGDRGVEVVDENALRVVRHIDAGIAFSVGTPNGHQVYSGGFLDGTLRRLASGGGEPR